MDKHGGDKHGDAIVVKGARVHNLKDVTAHVPLHSLTVVTGVSGSGKSSFAFDTLYAEGQRRYLASLSAYARQFLERIDRPDVDEIEGICPALAIRQKNHSKNPRSTVGTVTEINDYLRLLFARVGVTHCLKCGKPVSKDSPQSAAAFLLSLPALLPPSFGGSLRLYVCRRLELAPEAPPAGGKVSVEPRRMVKKAPAKPRAKAAASSAPPDAAKAQKEAEARLAASLPDLQRQGIVRLLVGGRLVDLPDALDALRESAGRDGVAEVRVVVDRVVLRDGEDVRARLADSLETCSRDSGGHIETLLLASGGDARALGDLIDAKHPGVRHVLRPDGVLCRFSEAFECQTCHIAYQEPEPRLFSFNNPFGACPECQGFGNTMTLDLGRVIPNSEKTLAEGAIHPWSTPRFKRLQALLVQFAGDEGIPTDVPWRDLPEEAREKVTRGKGRFPGILGFFEYLEGKKYKMYVRIFLSRYRGYAPCLRCGGERLRDEARAVRVGGRSITAIGKMTVSEAARFFAELELTAQQAGIAERLLEEIRRRLDLLVRVGLDYLSLDRLSSTLSGGEAQRIQLATALGSNLVGALYVLDEPSIGLHARDSRRLVGILKNLKELGNTVLVVEHDPEIIRAADHVIDIGPRAGEGGGRVVFEGAYDALLGDGARAADSLTRKYLSGELRIPVPIFRRKPTQRMVRLRGARKHNLKGIDVDIPLDTFVCVTGVSGSGKSTLVHDILYPALKKVNGGGRELPAGLGGIETVGRIDDIVLVDQSPIGRTPRSNPATYVKAFDDIRKVFAETRDAAGRGFGPGHFSFNMDAGRCPTCQGNGTVTVEMQFLADVELTCEDCGGRRFQNSVLEVRYKSLNIAEALELTVREAIDFFVGRATLVRKLKTLDEIGLGYLRLGQSATSLSGGEAQRIKLAAYISQAGTKNTLFVFDEPTTGLHFDDIHKLLAAFDKLLAAGNSLVVIEHNLDVIKTADWVIDLGPEGGDGGGRLVFAGTPEELARCEASHTGRELRPVL
ncbi:MAG: excinuclease ABC subunit UvrA [Acidobacteriota bacterium]|nr:excinuclease ABC subunit UvrA [Acidobacteriota bacterium]